MTPTSTREYELKEENQRLREANRRLQLEGPAVERDKLIVELRQRLVEGAELVAGFMCNEGDEYWPIQIYSRAKAFLDGIGTAPPVDMLLFCPNCAEQHVDEARPDVCETCGGNEAGCSCKTFSPWLNLPHKSHRCTSCNHVWRPADVPTNGVAENRTVGQRDESPIPRYQKLGTMQAQIKCADADLADTRAALLDLQMKSAVWIGERDAARADAATFRRFLNAEVMPRYEELFSGYFTLGEGQSVVVDEAKRLLSLPNPGPSLLAELAEARTELADLKAQLENRPVYKLWTPDDAATWDDTPDGSEARQWGEVVQ